MARKSTRENKNIYQRTREGLNLTREEASDLLVTMSPERIEKIEIFKTQAEENGEKGTDEQDPDAPSK